MNLIQIYLKIITSYIIKMSRFKDLTGKKFNMLTVLNLSPTRHQRAAMWECLCDCGEKTLVKGSKIISGHTKSCGCLNILSHTKHSHASSKGRTKVYRAWDGMKKRCYNPNSDSFYRYGGRGIEVCDRWKNSFENFLEDMRERPSKDHSLDRIDNDGDYTPENCRWTDWKTQARNRRCNYLVTYNGVKKSLVEWCEKFNINYSTAHSRLERGWDIPKIFTTPTKTPFISS